MSFRNSSGTSFHVFYSLRPKAVIILQHNFASRRSKIGITGRTTRIYRISTRTSSPTRRIIYEGKSSPRYADPKFARNGRNERELKNCELTNSECKDQEKIMRQYRSSLLNCRICKSRCIPSVIQKNFKNWNQITAGDCLTFPLK